MSHTPLPDYLRPPCDNLWAWSELGDTINWNVDTIQDRMDNTVAFASQLATILAEVNKRLDGLPPLTCVLEIIEACSSRWSKLACISRFTQLTLAANRSGATDSARAPVSAITKWLSEVHQLSEGYRRDIESHVAILTFALQDARQYLLEARGNEATDVINCLSVASTERDPGWARSMDAVHSLPRTKRTIEAFVQMSRQVISDQSIRLWRETNVRMLPAKEDIDAPPPRDPIAASLRKLSADEQWGAIALSAIATASMISLPRQPSDPDQLPIGGVSDVTNRGQPERLLMTELAQDPMVMLARIANGQALYLRRESPPGPSPDTRPVFLESGIRTWGETRLKIATLAMAVAAAEERRGESTAKLLTVAGHRHFAEDFTTTDGLIAQLGRTEVDEHPGEAIVRWLESIDEAADPIAEPIAIVSAATDADERFRRCLDSVKRGLLIAKVHRDQSVTLLRRTPLGDEELQSFQLQSVDPPTEAATASSVVRVPDSSLALFLDLDPCPLLFTDSLDGGWFAATDAPGLFTITRDYRLLWFASQGMGGVQLHDRLPHSNVRAYEASKHQIAMVVGTEEHYLIEADALNGSVEIVRLSTGSDNEASYHFDSGSLLRFGRYEIQLIDRQHGTIADQIDKRLLHIGGTLTANGQHLVLHSEQAGKIVTHVFAADPDQQTFLFAARDSNNTIVAITQDYSHFVHFAQQDVQYYKSDGHIPRKHAATPPPHVVYRSVSGDKLVLYDQFAHDGDRHLLVDLQQHLVKPIRFYSRGSMLYQFDPHVYQILQPRNFLSRFTGVEFNSDGTLALVKQKRKWTLAYDQTNQKLTLQSSGHGVTASRQSFGQSRRLDQLYGPTRWSLRPIRIGNNHVIADSRGLLHLRRGDDGTEVTLLLHQDHVSGWASWGELFGDQYHVADNSKAVSPTVLRWIEEFALQCNQSN